MRIEVNSVVIYSDKPVRQIVGTRVDFADGSWYDTANGQSVNKGSGYITTGVPPSEVAALSTTVGPKQYTAQPLEVNNVVADVAVEVHSGDYIEVTINGPKSSVENIRVVERSGSLVIESDEQNNRSIGTIISGGRGGGIAMGGKVRGMTIISGQNIVIGGGNSESDTKITVRVPKCNPISVTGVDGNTVIGDIEADLAVKVTTSGAVKAGRVRNSTLTVQGSGDIVIAEVQGNVSAQVMGSGDITVRSGNMPLVAATVMGSGDIEVKGKADNANLTVMGSGDIDVEFVKNKPMQSVMGHGDITVGNW